MPASETPEPSGEERSLRNTTRNPRRRQRQSDSDNLKTAPRRKRSKLSNDTFTPTVSDVPNGGGAVAPHDETYGNIPSQSWRESTPMLGAETELTMRGGKKQGLKRAHRSDGGTILTQNQVYSVKSLPSTPKELKVEGLAYRGCLSKSSSKCLAITNRCAYMWDYVAHTTTAVPRVFDLPFPYRPTDPLPFGALVTSSASTDVGLLLVSATSGKVVFYDSIDRAASLSRFHARGVVATEGSLGSMFSGETVTDLVDAATAGFLALTSSGRIIQLLLRDSAGRPRIQSQHLRAQDVDNGGIFGSIKGILGAGAWKRDTCAINTRALGQRGLMEVIGATERGEIQIWHLDWSGQYSFKGTFDSREELQKLLSDLGAPELQGKTHQIAIQDFAFTTNDGSVQDLTLNGKEIPLKLSLLVKVGETSLHSFVLVDIVLQDSKIRTTRQLLLKSYQPLRSDTQGRPRLLIPSPGHTAFVVFSNTITLAATTDPDLNTPEAQLHDSYISQDPFEDTVYLRQNEGLSFYGADAEHSRTGHASIITYTAGGPVRLQAHDPSGDVERSPLSIRTKLEEAVFYGSMQPDNILEFNLSSVTAQSIEEVEAAALALSREILRSETPLIAVGSVNMESNLAYRSQALDALLHHVRRNFPLLNQAVLWQLLWNAEKLAAGQSMWAVYQLHLEASERSHIGTVLEELSKPEWFPDDDMTSDENSVRKIFLYKLDVLDKILVRARMIATNAQQSREQSHKLLTWISEVDDLWISCLDKVYSFRMDHASAYGIPSDHLKGGILESVSDYVGLTEPWTATGTMLKASDELVRCARRAAKDEFETDPRDDDTISIHVRKIAEENASLLKLSFNIFQERIRWCGSRDSAREQEWSRRLQLKYDSTFHENCRALAEVGQAEAGMKLAEEYRDMHTLTEMVVAETQYLLEYLNEPDSEGQRANITQQIEDMNVRVKRYFDHFGDAWANAFFDQGFGEGKAGFMLREAQANWPEALTRYLRMQQDRAKVSWINDISQEHDYLQASEALNMIADEQETSLWSKKVELSLSRLADIAYSEQEEQGGRDMETKRDTYLSGLKLIEVQEKVYMMFLPEVRHCIDEQAEVEAVMSKWGRKYAELSAMTQLLEACVYKIITHSACSVEELIDVLTLIDFRASNTGEEDTPNGKEYFLALEALNTAAASMDRGRYDMLLRIIWKRCYIHDDWVSINSKTAQKKSDQDFGSVFRKTALWRTYYNAYEEGLFIKANCAVRPLLPSECVGAGCSGEGLRYRFPTEDLLQPILIDQKIQDENLQQYVTDRRLNHWAEACMQDAKDVVDLEAEETAGQLERERLFEVEYAEGPIESDGIKGNGNGHVVDANGVNHMSYGDSESGTGDEIQVQEH